jgi:O-antigen ligase
MNQVAARLARPIPVGALLLTTAAGAFALAVGLAAGDPGSGMLVPVAIILGLVVVGVVVARPFWGFLALVFSSFFLMVVPVAGTQRGVNVFDLVLIPLVAATLLGSARREAAAGDVLLAGPAHEAVRTAARRFGNSAMLYFGLAALSLLPMVIRPGLGPAFTSGLSLFRVVQGALVFPLALWWLRDEQRIGATLRAVFVAAVVFALVNCVWVFAFGVVRAGIVWWVTDVHEAIGSANEAAAALLVLWALAQARWAVRPSRWLIVLMCLVIVMLPLTQSRSGLLAFATFLLLTVRHVRWRWVLGCLLVLALVLPLVPTSFWIRMNRSLAFQQGTPEVFSFLLRIYGYRTAWHVFLDHPVFGVGYLGLRFVSVNYNEFHLLNLGAENFFLETLVGLGIVGLSILCVAIARLLALGRVVLRATAPKTFGHELARFHAPLMAALFVANLTGSTLVGMVGVGQLALWCALLIRAGHLAKNRALPARARGA